MLLKPPADDLRKSCGQTLSGCALSLWHPPRLRRQLRFEGVVKSRLLLRRLRLRFITEDGGQVRGSARRLCRALASVSLRQAPPHPAPPLACLTWLSFLTLAAVFSHTVRFSACAPPSVGPCRCWLPMAGMHRLFEEAGVTERPPPLPEDDSDEEDSGDWALLPRQAAVLVTGSFGETATAGVCFLD